MTTVAYDGVSLAADTQITSDWKLTGCSKFFKLPCGSIAAFAGSWSDVQKAHRWLSGLEDEKPAGEWSCIILRIDQSVELMDDSGLVLDITGRRLAVGSGSGFAMGAMFAGKTAEEAVVIASQLDPYTGGPVEVMRADEVRPSKAVKRKTSKTADGGKTA